MIELPTAYELDVARGVAMRDDCPGVKICRGTGRGCQEFKPESCAECYVVEPNDPRSSAEILQAMERGNA